MSTAAKNTILILLVIALVIIPLVINESAEFAGADGQAEILIGQINKDYQPWYSSFWEPPSGEIESLLFAVQAAVGSGFIGYYFGYVRGKKKQQKEQK